MRPWVLGISASHNGACCLLHGAEIRVAIQEERPVGLKRARVYGARRALGFRYCLDTAGITAANPKPFAWTKTADEILASICSIRPAYTRFSRRVGRATYWANHAVRTLAPSGDSV